MVTLNRELMSDIHISTGSQDDASSVTRCCFFQDLFLNILGTCFTFVRMAL
jgi:hypothetical protein